MFRRRFSVIVAVSLLIAACSSSESTPDESSSTTSGTTTTILSTTAAPTTTEAPASTTTAPPESTTTTATTTTTTTLPPEPAGFPVVHDGWRSWTNPNWVQEIAFDVDGMLWAAGLGGLVRWDVATGEYAELRSEHGAPGNQLTAVATTPDGAVWVGSIDAGIGRFDGERWSYFTTADGLPSDAVLALTATPDGTVWAATDQGLVTGGPTGFSAVEIPQELWGSGGADLVATPDGVVWLGASSLTRIEDGVAETFGADVIGEDGGINDLFVAADGSLYVMAVEAGLLHLVDGGFQAVPLPDDTFFGPDVIGVDDTWIWYASGDNVTRVGDDGVSEFWPESFLPFGLNVTDIVAGPDGTLWFAGFDGAVSSFGDGGWTTLWVPSDIPENRVWSVAEAADGAIWAVFPEAVGRFDGTDWDFWDMFCPCFLEPGPDGSMWLASIFEGVYQFDGTRWRQSYRADDGVVSVLATSDGDVWASNSWPPVVIRMIGGAWQEVPNPPLPEGWGLGLLSEGPDGTVWLGSDNGHYSWTGGGWNEHPQVTDGQWAFDTGGVWFGPDGTKWFYNISGFAHVNGAAEYWSGFNRGEFGFGQAAGITADASGAIWAATSGGIGSYDGSTWTVLDPLGGPSAWQINDLAAASDGSVWFATHGGLSRYGSPLDPSALVDQDAGTGDPADLAARAETAAADAETALALAIPACESMEAGFALLDDPAADLTNFDFEAWDRDVVACWEEAERALEAATAAEQYARQADAAAPGSAEAETAAAAAERARAAADQADEVRGDLELGP